jgi:hypothetical protein
MIGESHMTIDELKPLIASGEGETLEVEGNDRSAS